MPFRARNLFYLRISASDVIPLYLYLDERHIDWMSDRALQYVLADLRPLIIPKMKAESQVAEGPNGKKGTVDVHRGEFYQFAYFFRGTEPHSVILKTRNFTAAPDRPKGRMLPPPPPESDRQQRREKKRKKGTTSSRGEKAKGKERARTRDIDEEELEDFESDEDAMDDDDADYVPRSRSKRASRKSMRIAQKSTEIEDDDPVADGEDVEIVEGTNREPAVKEEVEDVLPATLAPDGPEPQVSSTAGSYRTIHRVVINVDEEEEDKPKPVLQLKYKGFRISGRCLCVVVEPWPLVRSASRAPSMAPLLSTGLRRPSIAPPDFVPSTELRERTPLFLPDDDERGGTPAPLLNKRVRPPVPLFNVPSPGRNADDNDESDMMAFSQALNSAGDLRGTEADDDDMDGAVLFGDADETREL